MTQSLEWSAGDAMDAAFQGGVGGIVDSAGAVTRLAMHRWAADADPTDHQLFLDPCSGSTLDVGCGPGRLVGALARRQRHALGIDVSAEAVRQTRGRGAAALQVDVFGPVPGWGLWHHVLLADGNIGIGGDPVRLLRRVRELLRPGGTALVEVTATGTGTLNTQLRLRVGDQTSEAFRWAFVGVDAISEVGAVAGLEVSDLRRAAGRHVAVLARPRSC